MVSAIYLIFTDGGEPKPVPPHWARWLRAELRELQVDPAHSLVLGSLLGPFGSVAARLRATRAFELHLEGSWRGEPSELLAAVHRAALEAFDGLRGVGVDLLALKPFPIDRAPEAVPERPLAEDVVSVAFRESPPGHLTARSYGLTKLGQREIALGFRGAELCAEVEHFFAQLTDWILDHRRRVLPGDPLVFGFDRVHFLERADVKAPAPLLDLPGTATLGALLGTGARTEGLVRDWRAAPLEVLVETSENGPASADLTALLGRTAAQRRTLEKYDLMGEAPHQSATATVRGRLLGLFNLTAVREEATTPRESGWHLLGTPTEALADTRLATLGELVAQVPGLLDYLAMPTGVRLEWDLKGELVVDASHVTQITADTVEPLGLL